MKPTAVAPDLNVKLGVRLCFQVWFRRGVNSYNPCGSGWISIGGEMLMVDVGLNDQVLLRLRFTFQLGSRLGWSGK